jgi:hypothetical protein
MILHGREFDLDHRAGGIKGRTRKGGGEAKRRSDTLDFSCRFNGGTNGGFVGTNLDFSMLPADS